jgi:hypothetical protein
MHKADVMYERSALARMYRLKGMDSRPLCYMVTREWGHAVNSKCPRTLIRRIIRK